MEVVWIISDAHAMNYKYIVITRNSPTPKDPSSYLVATQVFPPNKVARS
jgi:hypothetical protein